KKLAGGGFFKIPNRSVDQALRVLGYSKKEREAILDYLIGTNRLPAPAIYSEEGPKQPRVNRVNLKEKGWKDADLDRVDQALIKVFDLPSAFSPWTLGEECLERLGFGPEEYQRPGFSLLAELGFTQEMIAEANDFICGRHTVEGAPYLREEHLGVL